jgi:hypothetical protein
MGYIRLMTAYRTGSHVPLSMMAPSLLGNRRQERRFDFSSMIFCQNSHLRILARAKDISYSGISATGNLCPPKGSFLSVRFHLPGIIGFQECQGIVVRSHARGDWAIRFLEKSEPVPAPSLVQKYIDRQILTGSV